MDGGCTCGHVRYRLDGAPMFVNCCHCRWCQRETGSAFAVNALYETARVRLLSGVTETVLTPSESGRGQKIVRCPDCRVAVWSHYSSADTRVAFVRVGTLDDPSRLPPQAHIFVASKQPWVVIPAGAPQFAAFYDLQTQWPPDSIARRRDAMQARSAV
jgi:hypothetical protein